MTDRYIYHRDEFENDCIFFISEDLYEARTEKRLSLREVSYATGVPLEQIDLLECCPKEIDFRIIVKLLDFYQIRLNLAADAAVLSRPEPLFPRLCSAGNPANKKTAGRKICPRRFGNGYSAMSNLSGVTSAKLWS